MNVISCRRLSRRYVQPGIDPVLAVDGVSLEVEQGTFVAVEGPSGSGKTTLLGLLAGLEPPDEGSISVLGHDLGRLSGAERARLRQRRIGIVFQSFGLIASLSVVDNVGLPLLLAGVADGERRTRALGVLEEVGLGSAAENRVDELSGGERQRVGVARALAIEPALILADEPTGSLDEDNAAGVLELLRDAVRRRGASLVLVTHDPASAALADHRYQMRDGRLAAGVPA
ncbi:MAG: ABC transporter ATP-binding protein [Candidatus Limnocylindrales bacterium]